ncbi:hypothetical protein HF576_01900 [Microbacterium sp. CFH 90308]|uniref:Uncharacterized protein n=1 Tax=Microbacterium salsuginis TaxID=2722803 RepID=A0ABX1K6F9_9MICO|nr:hypothetical protein [Microbacterium sp. CFH 90308]NLP82592.1 hypothetical protein [Microbacterium sp. CFH 90308]
MAITPADLGGDEDLARRILVRARAVAPCITTFELDSDEGKDALAILKGVVARATIVGTGAVASQGRNGTTISFRDIRSSFAQEDLTGLRSLCGVDEAAAPGLPRGSFPKDRPLAKVWPEGEYS